MHAVVTAPAPRDLLGHPRGLFVLFFAEMWERFSFYGMRALLVLYLTKHFLFGDAQAALIYASYGSLVYLTPVIGGLIADRWLGFRRAIVCGAVLLCLGHLGMAVEGEPAVRSADGVLRDDFALGVMYASLGLIIVGVGFLKPSISSIVGQLYAEDDPRRTSGFTIFYMGINLGAFIATLACGYLGETWGWAWGFGLAGVGMLTGLGTFLWGRRFLEGAGEPPDPVKLTLRIAPLLSRERLIYAGGVIATALAWLMLDTPQLVRFLLLTVASVTIGYLLWFSVRQCNAVERGRLLSMLFLTSVSVVFWAFFEQAGSSLTLFTDRNVDREIVGITINASQFQSLNPCFIILLAPLFAMLWPWLARRGAEPSVPMKFGLGIVQVGLGFGALVAGAATATDGLVFAGWLALAYLLHTTGELCLSPVGLAMITRLSVTRIAGLMMGVWFLSSSFSHYVAGLIAATAAIDDAAGTGSPLETLPVYAGVFGTLAWIALAVGGALGLLAAIGAMFCGFLLTTGA